MSVPVTDFPSEDQEITLGRPQRPTTDANGQPVNAPPSPAPPTPRQPQPGTSWVDGLRPYTPDDTPTDGIQGIQATRALVESEEQTISSQRWQTQAEAYRRLRLTDALGELPDWYGRVVTHRPMYQFARRYMAAGEIVAGPDGPEGRTPRAVNLLRHYRPVVESALALEAVEKANPGKVPTDAELAQWIRDSSAQLRAMAGSDAARAPGWSRALGAIIGVTSDPAVLATLPLGAEGAAAKSGTIVKTALRAGATDAAIVTATEIPIQAQVFSFKEEIGSPYELKDAALNVLAAGLGAGVLRALGSAAVDLNAPFRERASAMLEGYRATKAAGVKTDPQADRAAVVLEDYLDELARNPFPDPEPHFAALEKASADMATMEPVRVEDITPPRAADLRASQESLLRAESDQLTEANRAAGVRGDPLERALYGATARIWRPARALDAVEWGLANGRPDIAQVALQRAEGLAEIAEGVAKEPGAAATPREREAYRKDASEKRAVVNEIRRALGQPAQAAPLTVPESVRIPGGVLPDLDRFQVLDPRELAVDAARFQFKGGGNAAGVTERLKGVEKFDPKLGGQVLVWEDAAGKRWIVDGHQRHGLAQRAIAGGQDPEQVKMFGYVLRETDGVSPSEARVVAAFKNIAEGTGTPIDAAKVLREAAGGERLLPPLPPNSALVRDARGLAQLEDEPFMAVVNEVIPAQYGAIVGDLIKGGPEQSAVIQLLAKLDPANATQARMIVEQARAAGFSKAKTGDLFGDADVAENLYLERAKVADAAVKRLRRDRSTFQTLEGRADTISAEGNVLDHQANQRRLADDEATLAAISRTFNQRGPISDALTEAARGLKSGDRLGAAADGFLAAVRRDAAGAAPRGADDAAGALTSKESQANQGVGAESQQAPKVQDFEAFATENGASRQDFGDAAMHRSSEHVSGAARKRLLARQDAADRALQAKRDALREQYDQLVAEGKVRAPTSEEQLTLAAQGEGDAAEAAKRVLEKRAARKVHQDLFGEAPTRAQELHDADLAVAARLSGEPIPASQGAGDLFSGVERQVDLVSVLGDDAAEVLARDQIELTDTLAGEGALLRVPEAVALTREGPVVATRPAGEQLLELKADGDAVNAVKLCAMGGGGGEG